MTKDSEEMPSIKEARAHPVASLETCRSNVERRDRSYRKFLRQTLVVVYAAYVGLMSDEAERSSFIEAANAAEMREEDIADDANDGDLLRLANQFVFGEKQSTNRMSKYARAQDIAWLRGATPKQFERLLEVAGIDRLAAYAQSELPVLGLSDDDLAKERERYRESYADFDEFVEWAEEIKTSAKERRLARANRERSMEAPDDDPVDEEDEEEDGPPEKAPRAKPAKPSSAHADDITDSVRLDRGSKLNLPREAFVTIGWQPLVVELAKTDFDSILKSGDGRFRITVEVSEAIAADWHIVRATDVERLDD